MYGYGFNEIIPENENARILCQYLYNNYDVKFPEKVMPEDIAMAMYCTLVNGTIYNNGRVCFVPMYTIDFDKWYEDSYINETI